MTKTPKADPWQGSEDETHTKKIMGKTVTFRSKPITKHFESLVKTAPKEMDAVNFEIVKAVVVDPKITKDEWGTLWVAVKMKILEEVRNITGMNGESFPE